jgi:hypothetical protein
MTTAQSRRRTHRSAVEWQAIFVQFDDSRLSVPAFCQREALCENSFRRWRARLADTAGANRPAVQSTAPAFVDLGPLVAAPAASEGRFELRLDLGGGVVFTLVRS